MSPMDSFGGGGLDPKLLMLLKQMGLDPSALTGGAPGGQSPALSPDIGGMSAPGVSPPGGPPQFGAQSQFGPPPGAPAPVDPNAAPSAPQAPAAGRGSPYLDAVNMTMGQAAFGPEERNLDRQMKLADELRTTATPEMRGNGRVQTAAHPLEFASAAANRIGGQLMADRTEGGQGDLFRKRMKQLREDMARGSGVGASAGTGGGYGGEY